MVEKYEHAKKIVAKKCGTKGYFYPFMVCALYGLLCKYQGHDDLIQDLFQKSIIIFEEGNILDIIQRNHLSLDVIDLLDEEDHSLKTFGVSNQGNILSIDENGVVVFQKEDPFVVCSLDHSSPAHLLNTFCHEMGHLIKGEENGYSSQEEGDQFVYVIRTGLAYYVYCYQNHFKNLKFITNFSTLDEAINCIQTTEVMDEILKMKDFVHDRRILQFLDSLDYEGMTMDWGYEPVIHLVRQLWEIDSFRSLVEDHIVLGDIDSIIHDINSLMGEDWFEQFSSILDDILEKWDAGEENSTLMQVCQSEVEKFKEKKKQKIMIK